MGETPVMPSVTVYCVNAFLLSLVLTLAMERIARRIGLVDVPTQRKNHEGQVPLVGVAMFLAFGIASMLLQRQPPGFAAFLLGLAFIVLIGVVDDLIDVRAPIKLIAQAVGVAMMVLPSDIVIQNIGNLVHGRPLLLLDWAVPATIFAVVGLINAINMVDGLDGLAGGVSLTALIWFAVAAGMIGSSDQLLLILVLVFSILGFLVFNFRHPWRVRAAVFLGDGGSMMLGMALSFVAISLSQRHGPSLSPVAALWICALPVIDTLSLMIRRIAAGQSALASDHRHLHHLLRRAGLTVNETVLILVAANAVLGGIGIVGWSIGVPDGALLLGLTGPVIFHSWFSGYGWKHIRLSRDPFMGTEPTIGRPQPSTK
ncbi:MAG: UDP-GlcNAc:undecaprenyl-phosphate/decaprenyl-phosphate GlcNAc-phosphate transferase [Rhodospirillaceae bacterium]|jgi:UDP-GlcNAc:undecaprenyl-phosphate GlcNAc-1-phosphate transferase|nr:UDP-GlcNAc:undecaprenyl-phosphate/decaprenyl-phosphate GlcNAc-phosphate transferase [Rhodospirillaceae bacterium]